MVNFSKGTARNLLLLFVGAISGYFIEFQTQTQPLNIEAGDWLYLFYPLIFGLLGIILSRGEKIVRLLYIVLLAVLLAVMYITSLNLNLNDSVALEGAGLHVLWVFGSCVAGGLAPLPFLKVKRANL